MEKFNSKLLILEDDMNFGKSLSKIITKQGWKVSLFSDPDEALDALKKQSYGLIITDILLPSMNGMEFCLKVRNELKKTDVDIIGMSGIFNDKLFIKEMKEKVQCLKFFKKPFDVKDLIEFLSVHYEITKEKERESFNQIFTKQDLNYRKILRSIEVIDGIESFELPFVYSLLIESKASGYLNIVNQEKKISGISFSKGKIIQVDMEEDNKLLGQLLIEKEFITPKELNFVLERQKQQRICEFLINENLLSPHAFILVMKEQMNIRLSKLVGGGYIQINFVPYEIVDNHQAYISKEELTPFLHDWINSKITFEWLNSYYHIWYQYELIPGPAFAEKDKLCFFPIFKQMKEFFDIIKQRRSLDYILKEMKFEKQTFLKGLHLALILRIVLFGKKVVLEESNKKMDRLTKVLKEISSKDNFEVIEMMGISPNANPIEIEKSYEEFLQLIKVHPNDDSEIISISQKIEQICKEAYLIATDKNARDEYMKQREMLKFQKKIKLEQKFEEGKEYLRKNNGKEAFKCFESILQINPNFSNVKLYYVWSKLVSKSDSKSKDDFFNEIELDLLQVPPEEKHSHLFPFIQGLHLKMQGKFNDSKEMFKKSAYLNPNFIEAKRELNIIRLKQRNISHSKNKDLKTWMTSIFRKPA